MPSFNFTAINCQAGTGQKYTYCGSSCQATCHDLGNINQECNSECVFGCRCPNGTLLDNEKNCVPVEKCTCYDKRRQKTYENGATLRRGLNHW